MASLTQLVNTAPKNTLFMFIIWLCGVFLMMSIGCEDQGASSLEPLPPETIDLNSGSGSQGGR